MTRQDALKLEAATFKADFQNLTWIRTMCKLIWSKFSSDTYQTPPKKKKKLCCLYFFKAAVVWNIWNFSSSAMTSLTTLVLKIHRYSSYLQHANHSTYKDFPYSCCVSEMQWDYFMHNCPRIPCFYRLYGDIIVTVWYVAFLSCRIQDH